MTELTSPRCYEDLVLILRAQIDRLGLGINQIDEICGFASGHMSNVFGPSRSKKLGFQSLWVLLPELGLRITVVEDETLLAQRRVPERPVTKYNVRNGNQSQAPGIHVLKRVLRHIGRIGGQKRMRIMSKRELREHQVKAAEARWIKKRRKV